MTRSIFDPTGNPERSGSRNLGPDAKDISQLPPEFTEGDEELATADDSAPDESETLKEIAEDEQEINPNDQAVKDSKNKARKA